MFFCARFLRSFMFIDSSALNFMTSRFSKYHPTTRLSQDILYLIPDIWSSKVVQFQFQHHNLSLPLLYQKAHDFLLPTHSELQEYVDNKRAEGEKQNMYKQRKRETSQDFQDDRDMWKQKIKRIQETPKLTAKLNPFYWVDIYLTCKHMSIYDFIQYNRLAASFSSIQLAEQQTKPTG